jgi:hypothetical protein
MKLKWQKRANTACTGRWGLPLCGVCGFQAFFWLRVFLLPSRVHARPSASNASRWARQSSHKDMVTFPMKFIAGLITLLIVSGCSVTTSELEATPELKCQTSPFTGDATNSPPEIQGTASSGYLWVLLFNTPIQANQEVKLVWKMTAGSGMIRLIADDSNGKMVQPTWGPDAHVESSWQRPGQEWGSGFIFPESGCWHILATRGLLPQQETITGEIILWVEP